MLPLIMGHKLSTPPLSYGPISLYLAMAITAATTTSPLPFLPPFLRSVALAGGRRPNGFLGLFLFEW